MMAVQPKSPLAERLLDRIATSGPISLASYMEACLGDPDGGYYQKQDPFGVAGDFVTAPEISGLFGEMCGLYLAHMYELSGGAANGVVIELGPGRGTLMRDIRHVWTALMPALAGLPLHFLETSPHLRSLQSEALQAGKIAGTTDSHWHSNIDEMLARLDGPIFGIANEFFDALPVAQYVHHNGSWLERLVDAEDDRLTIRTGTDSIGPDPALPAGPKDGMVAELCPAATSIMTALATHIARYGGAVLIIDYGMDGNPGDSLQAVADHKPVDILYRPGAADLSHWVDFAALGRAAADAGARLIPPVPQGDFLMRIGLAARAEAAAQHASPEERRALLAAIDRLTSPEQMGSVFKVALLVPAGEGLPPGFLPDGADAAVGNDERPAR